MGKEMPDESYVICILKIESAAKRSLEFGELTVKSSSSSAGLALAIDSNIKMFSRTRKPKISTQRSCEEYFRCSCSGLVCFFFARASLTPTETANSLCVSFGVRVMRA